MATVKVNQASIDELKSAITFSAEQTAQAAGLVTKAVNGLSGMSFAAKPRLESELETLKSRLNKQAQLGQACCRAVQETVDALIQVDDSAGSSAKGVLNGTSVLAGAVVAGTVPRGLPLAIEELLKKVNDICREFIDGTSGAGSASTPDIAGNNQGSGSSYQNQLPDWALENVDTDSSDYYKMKYLDADGKEAIGSVNKYIDVWDKNGHHQVVSCTYYTLRKLRDKGLGFPFQANKTDGGYWNGWQWYDNSVGVEKAEGNASIQQLLDSFGGKNKCVENVVVSFNGNHVLLLDKVFVDSDGVAQVSYSDTTVWGNPIGYLTDLKGTSPLMQESLNDFIYRYTVNNSRIFGDGIIGSVLIGS